MPIGCTYNMQYHVSGIPDWAEPQSSMEDPGLTHRGTDKNEVREEELAATNQQEELRSSPVPHSYDEHQNQEEFQIREDTTEAQT